jgi:hypothetical protein
LFGVGEDPGSFFVDGHYFVDFCAAADLFIGHAKLGCVERRLTKQFKSSFDIVFLVELNELERLQTALDYFVLVP